jgi:hypothetical protein
VSPWPSRPAQTLCWLYGYVCDVNLSIVMCRANVGLCPRSFVLYALMNVTRQLQGFLNLLVFLSNGKVQVELLQVGNTIGSKVWCRIYTPPPLTVTPTRPGGASS